MPDYIQVFTAVDSKEAAEKIASTLLDKRLAGCVQLVGPIQSRYWWQGKQESAEEWLCIIKSSRAQYAEIEKVIRGVHPYETPEILAVPIVAGYKSYLDWLSGELQS